MARVEGAASGSGVAGPTDQPEHAGTCGLEWRGGGQEGPGPGPGPREGEIRGTWAPWGRAENPSRCTRPRHAKCCGNTWRSHDLHEHVEVTWRSRGGHVEVTWRSRGGHVTGRVTAHVTSRPWAASAGGARDCSLSPGPWAVGGSLWPGWAHDASAIPTRHGSRCPGTARQTGPGAPDVATEGRGGWGRAGRGPASRAGPSAGQTSGGSRPGAAGRPRLRVPRHGGASLGGGLFDSSGP